MPKALVPDYAIRILKKNNRLRLQYRRTDENGEHHWVNAYIVDERGTVLGDSIEVITEP